MRARIREVLLWTVVAGGLVVVATKLEDQRHTDRGRAEQVDLAARHAAA